MNEQYCVIYVVCLKALLRLVVKNLDVIILLLIRSQIPRYKSII